MFSSCNLYPEYICTALVFLQYLCCFCPANGLHLAKDPDAVLTRVNRRSRSYRYEDSYVPAYNLYVNHPEGRRVPRQAETEPHLAAGDDQPQRPHGPDLTAANRYNARLSFNDTEGDYDQVDGNQQITGYQSSSSDEPSATGNGQDGSAHGYRGDEGRRNDSYADNNYNRLNEEYERLRNENSHVQRRGDYVDGGYSRLNRSLPGYRSGETSFNEFSYRENGQSAPRQYGYEDTKQCSFVTRQTKSSHADIPTTVASAIVSTPTGDFVLYCTESPASIISFQLHCYEELNDGSAIGSTAVTAHIEHSCHQLKVVEDLNNLQVPVPLVVALMKGHYSTAYKADYESGAFKLVPTHEAFQFKYLTDLETFFLGDKGMLLLFSNNNHEKDATFAHTVAPIYLSKNGVINLCGFTDIQHTQKVTVWRRPDKPHVLIVMYLQVRDNSRRSLLHLYELRIHNGRCTTEPYMHQRTIGAAEYNGERNTLHAYEPFTVDHCLCGAEDIQFLSSKPHRTSSHIIVGLSLHAENENGAFCPLAERLVPSNAFDKSFCCCTHTNQRSFLLEYSRKTRKFGSFTRHTSGIQEVLSLRGGGDAVTEITEIETEDCCNMFQTVSPSGQTELFTIESDTDGRPQVYRFLDHGLPHYAHASSLGYCDSNDIIMSYSLHSFQPDDTIFHLRCNKKQQQDQGYVSSPNHGSMPTSLQRSRQPWLDYGSAYYSRQPYNRTILRNHPNPGSIYSPLAHSHGAPKYQPKIPTIPSRSGRLSAVYPDPDDYRGRNITALLARPRARIPTYPLARPAANQRPVAPSIYTPPSGSARSVQFVAPQPISAGSTIRINSTEDLGVLPVPTYSIYIHTGRNDTDGLPGQVYRPPRFEFPGPVQMPRMYNRTRAVG